MNRYEFAPKSPTQLHQNPLISQLLFSRNITDAQAIDQFLKPDYESGRHDPFLMAGMETAVTRLLDALEKKHRIAIYADYDSDGIPGAVVLHDFLTAVGHTNFTTYIPHRHYEGFGLNTEAVDKLAADKVELIITIDCGTTDHEAVVAANKKGLDVIITDHHEPKETLPEAVAVVNPKIGDSYPFKDLCGAGVIFKVVEAVLARGNFSVAPGWEKWWLDMVGVATINDMVPLVGENRVFAHYGLQVLRKSRRPGLQQLIKQARGNQRLLTEDDVGFTIGPRINAASRMDTPEAAFTLLSTTEEGEAGAQVRHLEGLNNERKGLVAAMTKELHKRLQALDDLPPVLVLGSPTWRPSLVGLAANTLATEYSRPAFLWGRDGNGVIKGSCRSDGNTSVVRLMEIVPEAFLEFGGHHMSGGFAVTDEAIFTLPDQLNDAFTTLATVPEPTHKTTVIDATLELNDVTSDLVTALRTLAPYGMGNPKPLFSFTAVVPQVVTQFGKTKEHLKVVFETSTGSLEAIAFFANDTSFARAPVVGEAITLLAHVEESYFMNRRQIRLRIVDFL